jgi:hypothetical protein
MMQSWEHVGIVWCLQQKKRSLFIQQCHGVLVCRQRQYKRTAGHAAPAGVKLTQLPSLLSSCPCRSTTARLRSQLHRSVVAEQ